MSKQYKNDIILQTDQGPVSCGDPFVLRFNGKYYLYPSTDYREIGIRCFVSTNLVDWEYAGIVCDDSVTKNAYAPEVIYAYEKFFLCTSPGGNGHYFFVADNPLGPFHRITDNVANLIDGTFFLDHDETLYFARANHKGITILKMDKKANLKQRVDLNAELFGWTEGPYIIYEDGFYFLTYCGNHLESRGYRVDYGTSRELLGDYRRGKNNPLLISTHDEFYAIGHSCTVLAPDLDGYYIVYHRLKHQNDGFFRTYNVDRLGFNGRQLSTQITYFSVDKPCLPDVYEWLDESRRYFKISSPFILSQKQTDKSYTAEFTFINRGELKIVFDYYDEKNYLMLEPKHDELSLYHIKDGQKLKVTSTGTGLNFHNYHTIRIRAKERIEVYLDNMLKMKVPITVKGGKIGYKDFSGAILGFTAFTNDAFHSRDKKLYKNLPCYIESTHCLEEYVLTLDPIDELYFLTLKAGDKASFRVSSHEKAEYGLAIYCQSDDEALVQISTNDCSQKVYISKNDNPYPFCKKQLATLTIEGKNRLTLKVLKGQLKMKFIDLYRLELPVQDVHQGFVKDGTTIYAREKVKNVLLYKPRGFVKEIRVDFMLTDGNVAEHNGGILLNVTNYSDFPTQVEHSYCGYYISFNNWLIKVDRASYGLSRMYDKPINIGINKKHHLRVTFNDTKLTVYVDDECLFSCYDEYVYHYGMYGLYTSKIGHIVFSNLEIIYK